MVILMNGYEICIFLCLIWFKLEYSVFVFVVVRKIDFKIKIFLWFFGLNNNFKL